MLESILEQFPFVIRGFHSDNGSEFINYNVVRLLDKLRIEPTKSRAHHCGDNGLVETKNGAVIRKHIGFGYIDAKHAEAVDQFHREHLNPYVNFHRPCAVPKILTAANGKRRRIYLRWATPFELFREMPQCAKLPAAAGHASGTGSFCPEPIRYRSCSGDAARQAQTFSKLPAEEHRMIHCRPRFPLVGDRTLYPDEAKSKTQNLPKKGKPRPDMGAQHASRWLGPGPFKNHQKGGPTARLPPRRFSGSSFDENTLLTTLVSCLRSRRENHGNARPARLCRSRACHKT